MYPKDILHSVNLYNSVVFIPTLLEWKASQLLCNKLSLLSLGFFLLQL